MNIIRMLATYLVRIKPSLCQLSAVVDDHGLRRLTALRADSLDFFHDVHAFGHVAEHHMLAIKPVCLDSAEEELRTVCARPCVGHGKYARACVLQFEILVGEFGTIDG